MFTRLDLRGIHTTVDDNLKKYVTKKIGRLDKYLARPSRESAHIEIRLKEENAKNKKQCICDVTLHLPKGTVNVKESTVNMYAAVDIVESKLKQKIMQYKDSQMNGKMRRHLWGRMRHRAV